MTEFRPPERPSTFDESGKRLYLYPAAVDGIYRRRKNIVHSALILFFLVLPWIHIGGRQLLLLDVANREFFIFFLHFRAHDAPMLLFLILGFAFFIGMITAIWGRLWCGWACPQTVFIDTVYRKVEMWIEGNHRQRKELDAAPWNGRKVAIKSTKFLAFLAISLVITHSFLAYFVGSKELIAMVTSSPTENWTSFLVIIIATGIIMLDFAWFREQFCIIMCPYGRFQSVLMDSHSLVVGYDTARGEPRRGVDTGKGDCVNCLKCVQVCPTGIDIRNGIQMECIACTACVDACHEVMQKVKKPTGLIRYTTLRELRGQKAKAIRPRSIAYFVLLTIAVLALTISLNKKDFLEIAILRAKEIPYQVMETQSGKVVVNHMRFDISNQTGKEEIVTVSLSDEDKAAGIELVFPMNPVKVIDGGHPRVDFFIKAPINVFSNGAKIVKLNILGQKLNKREVTIVGPIVY